MAEHEQGLASGLINASQQFGGALGLAIVLTVATTRPDHLLGAGASVPQALTHGFQDGFLTAAVIARSA